MFRRTLELKDSLLKEKNRQLRASERENWQLRQRIDQLRDNQRFLIDKAKFEKAKEMKRKLIESDMKRTEAVAKLDAYLDMDTKSERDHIQKMLEKAITGLANRKVEVIK